MQPRKEIGQESRYLFSYLPLDEPTSITGLSVVGAGNDTIANGYLRIISSGSYPFHRYYTWNNLPTSATASDYTNQGIIVRSSCIAQSGGNATLNRRGFTLEMDNGTNRYEIAVYITTTQIRIRDVSGGSDIATVSHDNTEGYSVFN